MCSPCCQDLGHASSKTLTHLTEKCSRQDHHYVRWRREAGQPGGHHHVWARLWKPLHAFWGWAKLRSPYTSDPCTRQPLGPTLLPSSAQWQDLSSDRESHAVWRNQRSCEMSSASVSMSLWVCFGGGGEGFIFFTVGFVDLKFWWFLRQDLAT